MIEREIPEPKWKVIIAGKAAIAFLGTIRYLNACLRIEESERSLGNNDTTDDRKGIRLV